MSTQTEWIVKEARVTVILPGEPENEAHVMPARLVPERFRTEIEQELYLMDLRKAGDPLHSFQGKLYAHWGHVASKDCECHPELTVDVAQGTAVWTHKPPA